MSWSSTFTPATRPEEAEASQLSAENENLPVLPVPEQIAAYRRKLNLLGLLRFNAETQNEIARVAGEMVVNQLAGEKALVIDRIINGVALGKRKNLKFFLEDVAITDSEILDINERTKKALADRMQAEITEIVREKKRWKDASKALLDTGEIELADYELMLLMHDQEAAELITSKHSDRNTVRDTYRRRIEQALRDYVERNPSYS